MNYSLDQDELEAIESSEGAEIMRNGVHILTATILVVAILMSVRMDLSLAVLNLVLLSLFAGLYFVGSYYLERMTGVWKLAWLIARSEDTRLNSSHHTKSRMPSSA